MSNSCYVKYFEMFDTDDSFFLYLDHAFSWIKCPQCLQASLCVTYQAWDQDLEFDRWKHSYLFKAAIW